MSADRAPNEDHIPLPGLPKWVRKLAMSIKSAPPVDIASLMVRVLILGITVFIVLVGISAIVEFLDHGNTGTSENSQFDTSNAR